MIPLAQEGLEKGCPGQTGNMLSGAYAPDSAGSSGSVGVSTRGKKVHSPEVWRQRGLANDGKDATDGMEAISFRMQEGILRSCPGLGVNRRQERNEKDLWLSPGAQRHISFSLNASGLILYLRKHTSIQSVK